MELMGLKLDRIRRAERRDISNIQFSRDFSGLNAVSTELIVRGAVEALA